MPRPRYSPLVVAVAFPLLLLLSAGVVAGTPRGAPAPAGGANLATVPLLSIQPASQQAYPGLEFTVSLVISDVSSLGAYEATVFYNPSVLQPLAATHPSPSF